MEYEFEQLTKEIVVGRLLGATDAAGAAADAAREILGTAIDSTRVRQTPRLTVVAVCRGAMEGLLQIHKDVPGGAVALLLQAGRVAHGSLLAPDDCARWITEGIASACRQAPETTRAQTRMALERTVPGCGRIFDEVVSAQD